MTGGHKDAPDLGAYALGGLTAAEEAGIDEHVGQCETCRDELAELREMADRLGEVPPEFFLEGPPEGGDLLVRRAVTRVRAERRSALTRRRLLTGAAAVLLGALLLGAGVVAGRQSAPVAPTASAPVAGTRTVSSTDAQTGAAITAQVVPAAGWVRVSADVRGIPAGQRCRLVVVGADGQRQVAGSWLVSAKGAAAGTELQGSAVVEPTQVRSIVVENLDGRQYVSAAVS